MVYPATALRIYKHPVIIQYAPPRIKIIFMRVLQAAVIWKFSPPLKSEQIKDRHVEHLN